MMKPLPGALSSGCRVLAIAAATMIVGGILFELFRPADLSWDGLWNARAGVWAGLLLFANLILLW
jgi:hypothetical protein